MAKNPLSISRNIFEEADVPCNSRATRCSILREIGYLGSAKKIPPLSTANIQKRLVWAKENMKTDFNNVIFTDECRVTLDGPDGFRRGWFLNGQEASTQVRRQQGGGGVMFWAALHNKMLIGKIFFYDIYFNDISTLNDIYL